MNHVCTHGLAVFHKLICWKLGPQCKCGGRQDPESWLGFEALFLQETNAVIVITRTSDYRRGTMAKE